MAAPGAPASPLAQVALAAPLPSPAASGGTPTLLHLTLQPALPGRNAATMWVTDAAGALPADLPAIQLRFSPLDHAAPAATLAPPLDPNDGAGAGAIDLPGAGWWAVEATVTPRDGPAARTTLYLILPDPNVTGGGPLPPDDPRAKAVFERGLAGMTSLKNVRFAQTLGDGGGSVYTSESAVTTNPPAFEERSANATVIVADGQQWIKAGDAPWSVSPAASVPLPSTWGDAYTPVAGFRLGPIETVAGEPCQVVTFYHLNQVGRQWAPTWYAWWVGTDSGRVHREAMVSTRHYMIYNYSAFDAPATIEPPAGANGPGATPGP
ncbi:MAG TPA: hypothetical protein VFI22_07605, partial [Thermomicrobiales bacterium]|nr:hypothetical protein [Thermomicrobiales bacterium]